MIASRLVACWPRGPVRWRAGAAGRCQRGAGCEQGLLLERAPLRKMTLWAHCGCGESHGEEPEEGMVQALLPDPGRGVVLRLVRNGEEIWSRESPGVPPEVQEVTALVEGDALSGALEPLDIRYLCCRARSALVADDGRSWQALAVMLQDDEALVPAEMLTSGPVLVQVIVSDGFNTTLSEPVIVDVPARPPHVAILWPRVSGLAQAGAMVRLWGVATASDGRTLPEDALQWELDGQPAGSGSEVWVDLPDWEGEHCATLRASDGAMQAKASVVFMATHSGQAPYRQSQC